MMLAFMIKKDFIMNNDSYKAMIYFYFPNYTKLNIYKYFNPPIKLSKT